MVSTTLAGRRRRRGGAAPTGGDRQYMYLPLLVFDRASGLLLGVRLQAGNAHAGQRVVQLLAPMVRSLRRAWPEVEIVVRGDAGLATPGLYEFCEANRLGYLIGIAANAVLKERSQWAVSWLSQRWGKDRQPHRWIGGFSYQAGSWSRARRIVPSAGRRRGDRYKAEVNAQGTKQRFVVTNRPGLPLHLYRSYCDRGTAETFIEQVKNALKADRSARAAPADRLSCRRFVANAFRLTLYALAYNLLRVLSRCCRQTSLEAASVETLRSRLVKIGARIRTTARRVWVHLASGFPLPEVLAVVLKRIAALPHAPPPAS